MKKAIQVVFFFGVAFCVKPAWAVKIDTAYVYTQIYSTDSTKILLVVQARVGSSPCSVYYSNITDSLNFIQLDVCYVGGSALSICTTRDTFDLGIKKNNIFNILAIFKAYAGPGQCISSNFNKDSFDITANTISTDILSVRNTNSIIRISPNPATNQLNISIDESLVGVQLNIYNVTGSLVQSAQLQIVNSTFEIQNLPNGVYVAVVTTPKSPKGDFNTVMRRWVKM